MATQTYMYLNNGTKVPVYGNANTHSMPYRAYTSETTSAAGGTTGTSGRRMTTTAYGNTANVQTGTDAQDNLRQQKINAIMASKESEKKRLKNNYALLKKSAKQTNADNLKQLYIAYMQGMRGIPQQSAVWGAGGEIESLKNRSHLNYESNRASENRNYAGVLGDIQQKYNDDLNKLEQKYLQQLLNV